MRDTEYARELATAEIGQSRIERLFVKDLGQEEIRFSWWKDGQMMARPLDLPEDELLELLALALKQNVFSTKFKLGLRKLLVQ